MLVEELGQAVDQVAARRRRQGDPARLGGVVAGDRAGRPRGRSTRSRGSRSGASSLDALDPAEQLAAHALEARLLPQLPDHGLGQQLARLDPAAGHRPLPRRRAVAPPDQQQAVVRPRRPRRRRASGRMSRVEAPVHDDGPGHQPEAPRRSSWWPGCRAGRARRRPRQPRSAAQASDGVHHRLPDADAPGPGLDVEVARPRASSPLVGQRLERGRRRSRRPCRRWCPRAPGCRGRPGRRRGRRRAGSGRAAWRPTRPRPSGRPARR